jgi:hypothetical protein
MSKASMEGGSANGQHRLLIAASLISFDLHLEMSRGGRTVCGIRCVDRSAPAGVNGENSRAKLRNVREDSCRWATVSAET